MQRVVRGPYCPESITRIIRLMRKAVLLILILTSSVPAGGKKGYFGIETVRRGTDFSFPIIKHTAAKRVEPRINQLLQLSELQRLARRSAKNIFDQTSVDDGSMYGGKTGMNPTIHSNNRRILSVGFD